MNAGQNTVERKSIRGIDPELWRQFKAEAAIQGREMGELLSQLLRAYVQVMAKRRQPEDAG